MPEDKKPILDPERELPNPHDMQLNSGYEAQLGDAHKANLPLTHYQNLPKPGFFSRYKSFVFILPIMLLIISAAAATMLVSNAKKVPTPAPTQAAVSPTMQPATPVPQWKYYKSELHSVSFEYPQHFTNPEETATEILLVQNDTQISINFSKSRFFDLPVLRDCDERITKSDDFGCLEQGENVGQIDDIVDTTVGSVPAKSFFVLQSSGSRMHVIQTTKAPFVELSSVVNKETDAYFSHLLTSFRFTDISSGQGTFCGGIAGIACPAGYSCKLDGTYPDAGGTCFPNSAPGGKLITPTPTAFMMKDPEPVSAAKAALAKKLGVSESSIQVIAVVEQEWSDSSLGCPKPGMMYMQVITPGYLVTLSDGTKQYKYHTDRSTRVVDCTK